MMYNNNSIVKKIGLSLVLIVLAGCMPIGRANSSPLDKTDVAKTLAATPDTSIPQTPGSTSTPAPVLMASNISSGWAVYSVWVSQNPVVSQIFLKNLDTGEITQLTYTGSNSRPMWSPDGSQIMFLSWTEENSFDIYLMDKDGKNQRPIVAGPATEMMADWSPDGKKIAYVSNLGGDDEIYVLDLQTHISTKILIASDVSSKFPKWSPALPKWSPDGQRIAFVSGTGLSGTSQIFVINVDGTDVTQMTDYDLQDLHYDDNPAWCPDMSCIVFTRDLPKLMMLDMTTQEVTPLLNGIFPPEKHEYTPTRSRDYLTFDVEGVFYAIDMQSKKIYPLGIEGVGASYLSLYP